MKDFHSTFFYKSAKLISKNKIFLFIVIILDYSQVLFPSIELSENIIKYISPNQNATVSINFLSYFKYLSMFSLVELISTCDGSNSSKALSKCKAPTYPLYIIFGFLALFYIFLLCTYKNWVKIRPERQKKTSLQAVYQSIKKCIYAFIIYYYNIFFFRLLSPFLIAIIINVVVNSVFSDLKLLLFVGSLFLMIIYSYTTIAYFHNVHIYIKLDNDLLNFPFDHFSSKFDIFCFIFKVLISFEHNLSLHLKEGHDMDKLDLPLFFGVVAFAFMSITTGKWFHEIFLSPKSLLFNTNTDMNLFRLFINLFNVFALIVIIISSNTQNYTVFISLLVSTALVALIIIRQSNLYRESKAINSGNYVLLMIFLIDFIWYGYSNTDGLIANCDKKYAAVIKRVTICHLSSCKKSFNNCSLCKAIKSQPELSTYSYESHAYLFSILYDLISADKKLIEDHTEEYDILTFFHKSKLNINNPFNHSVNIAKSIRNTQNGHCYYLNINIYYRNYIKVQKAIIARIESIHFIEKKTDELFAFISKLENMLFFEEKKPTNIIDGATFLYKLIKHVKHELFSRLNSKNEYHSIIMQYIIESLTNSKLNFKDRILFDISLYEEFLTDHFEADKNIVLAFEYNSNMAYISLVGSDLIEYLKKPFSDIFHSSIREHAMEHFNYCLANTISNSTMLSKNLFCFPISDKDNQSNVMSFKLKYSPMPSIRLETSLITGIYQINYDDVIVALYDRKRHSEFLLAYNKPLTRHLIIPNDFIGHLNQFHSTLAINSIFSTVSGISSHTKDNLYIIDYKNYLPVVQTKINLLLTDIKDSEIQIKLPKLNDLNQYKTKVKKMIIKDKIEYQCSKSPYLCIVYLILSEDNTVICAKKDDFFSKFNILEDNLFVSFQNTRTTSTGNFLNSNSSVDLHNSNSASNKFMSGLSLEIRQKLQEDVTRKKKELKKFKTLTYIIIIFNSILVVITIAFLIFDIDAIIRFDDIFTFFQLWNRFICLFFNTSISIFTNFCVALPKATNCTNTLDKYSSEFNADADLPDKFFIGNYLKYELTVKADLLQEYSKEVIKYIYSSMGKEATSILDSDYNYRYITFEGEKIVASLEVYSLLSGIDVYINLINSMVNNLNYTKLPIYIINIQGPLVTDIYLDNINKHAFSIVQMIEYNLLLNYPNFIGSFMILNDIMSSQLDYYIDRCFNIINVFVILLISIHIILFSICTIFINFYQNVIEDYYNESLFKISLVPLMIGIKEKLLILKDILMYFKADPNKKIDQYNALVKKSTTRGEANKQSSSLATVDPDLKKKKKKSQTKRTFTIFNGVIKKSTLIIIFTSFIAYFLYSGIFYLLLFLSINDYNHLIRTVDFGSNLDIYLYSVIGIIQMMLLTNQTDHEIGVYLNTEQEKGYVRNLMDKAYYLLDQIENDETDKQTLIPRLRESIDLSCDTVFETLNDEIIIATDKKYVERNYLSLMPNICSAFAIMKMKSDKLMINSLMFTLNKILLVIVNEIKPLFALMTSKDIFDLNVLVLMIYRPIRIYESSTLNTQIIDKMTLSYNTITYVYLLFNIVIEIVLLVLLRTFLIQKCIQIQKSMNMFVKCLKI